MLLSRKKLHEKEEEYGVNEMKSTGSKEYKINEQVILRLKDGKAQLQIKNILFKHSKYLLLNISTDNLNYRINDYMSLRLENSEINLYVKGERIVQFNSQLISIPSYKPNYKVERNSVYETAFHINSNFPKNHKVDVPPEIMFWAIYSNLQAWIDSNYDVRLLYFKLAFDLLKNLNERNDPIAKKVFKEEIAKSFEKGDPFVMTYLVSNNFLDHLNREELEVIFRNYDIKQLESLSLLSRILLLEKIHQLGLDQDGVPIEKKIKKELKGLDSEALIELFGDYFSNFATKFMNELKDEKSRNKDNKTILTDENTQGTL